MTTWDVLHRETRGGGEHGWLSTRHTFSFAHWFNPERMGFGPLRVINEDKVSGGAGFGAHPHQDMEIISFPLAGELRHRDSMGHGSSVFPGEIQYMSAGTGVYHSEMNGSETDELHFLQIWIQPNAKRQKPRYGQLRWDDERAHNALRVVASADGEDDSIAIRQDARLLVGKFDKGKGASIELDSNRSVFVHVATGAVSVDGQLLRGGDSASVTGLDKLKIAARDHSQVLVFDLP